MNLPPLPQSFVRPNETQYAAVSKVLLPRLATELPATLFYHNVDHTKGVIRDCDYLIAHESVPAEDRWMILTAALFHDSGFLQVYSGHEQKSCALAQQMLPDYDYSPGCINAICKMISATQLPQTPVDWYGSILCDADLFYFGTDDFFDTAEKLFHELTGLGLIKDRQEWNEKQLSFLTTHHYFTRTANAELEPKKRALIAVLQEQYT